MRKLLWALLALLVLAPAAWATANTLSVSGNNLKCSTNGGTAAACGQNVTVADGDTLTISATADPPPPPAKPTAAFAISPQPVVAGQPATFDAASSTCNATPCSYAWTDPTDGQNYSTASKFSYTFNSQTAHQMKLVVTDSLNQTDTVTQSFTPTAPAPPPPTTTHCAGTDGSGVVSQAALDGCGFPSTNTTGVPAGTTLTAYTGPSNITTAGTVINGARITKALTISANNVTIENSDLALADPNGNTGAIKIGSGTTGAVVKYDTIHGTAASSSGDLQAAVNNTNYSDDQNAVTIDHVQFYNGQRIMHGPGTLTNSYCLDNVAVSGAHYECIYEGGGGVTVDHNTLLVSFSQTAAIFMSTDFAALQDVKLTNNLLAGGGYVVYADATNEHNYGVRSETITGNHFSKLYYPNSGMWGPLYGDSLPAGATWSGNVWDDTGNTVSP